MKFAQTFFALIALALTHSLSAAEPVTISVQSPAMVFSPGNWTGDTGRGGNVYRQTWNAGAYFRVTWETSADKPTAKLLLDTSTYPPNFKLPQIAYNIDGVWKSKITCTNEIMIEGLTGKGRHELTVYLQQSQQLERWGSEGKSPLNVLRVTGLQLDPGSKPIAAAPAKKWAWIIGDSITEGIGATELSVYSHLLGLALQTRDFEYCVSACGWSGWIHRGDTPPGDVPAFYNITNSVNGTGGVHDDASSRWNKIDGNNHSLLDAKGRISGYGEKNQEPALITINYGTNEAIHKSNPSDTKASMVQSLAVLRKSAPSAKIVIIIPFGQYYAAELKDAVALHRKKHPRDKSVYIIDLGPGAAKGLAEKNSVMGGLHPNDRGHAMFASQIIPRVLEILGSR
ncbi:MAG TPA: SGNH/GDSL hydrolase family protein [Verrucomicrobiae bacterium]